MRSNCCLWYVALCELTVALFSQHCDSISFDSRKCHRQCFVGWECKPNNEEYNEISTEEVFILASATSINWRRKNRFRFFQIWYNAWLNSSGSHNRALDFLEERLPKLQLNFCRAFHIIVALSNNWKTTNVLHASIFRYYNGFTNCNFVRSCHKYFETHSTENDYDTDLDCLS